MAGMPSDSELEVAVREIIRVVNAEEASLKIIRQKLEARFKVRCLNHPLLPQDLQGRHRQQRKEGNKAGIEG